MCEAPYLPPQPSHLNKILTLGDCFGERVTLKVVLRHLSCKYIKIHSFGCKVPLWCVLTEKWHIKEHQVFLALLAVD